VKALLAGTTARARQMLRKILDGRKLDAEPIVRSGRGGYRLSGELCVGFEHESLLVHSENRGRTIDQRTCTSTDGNAHDYSTALSLGTPARALPRHYVAWALTSE
jgi:hypothetical protein